MIDLSGWWIETAELSFLFKEDRIVIKHSKTARRFAAAGLWAGLVACGVGSALFLFWHVISYALPEYVAWDERAGMFCLPFALGFAAAIIIAKKQLGKVIVLDRKNHSITENLAKVVDLRDAKSLRLSTVWQEDRFAFYPIDLLHGQEAKSYRLAKFKSHADSARLAGEVSKFLNLPIED